MDDERIPTRALLGAKDFFDCRLVQGICAQTVDGFGWESDQAPGSQDCRGFLQPVTLWETGVDFDNVAGVFIHGGRTVAQAATRGNRQLLMGVPCKGLRQAARDGRCGWQTGRNNRQFSANV